MSILLNLQMLKATQDEHYYKECLIELDLMLESGRIDKELYDNVVEDIELIYNRRDDNGS